MLRPRFPLASTLVVLFTLAFGCGGAGAPEERAEQELLPNEGFTQREYDAEGLGKVAEHFRRIGFDVHVDLEHFEPSWPLRGDKTAALNRLGTPLLAGSQVYFHSGFDVIRASGHQSADVLAPHDGLALTFDWWGTPGTPEDPYKAVVAIWDPASHVITTLMHVEPTAALRAARAPVEIRRGVVVGKLAETSEPLDRHTHVDFIDGSQMKLLNPGALFAGYHDDVPPVWKSVYLADERARLSRKVVSGDIDVVAEVFDRDDDSNRNFEVSEIAFTIADESGHVLLGTPRCNLDHIHESIRQSRSRAKRLFDIESATSIDAPQDQQWWGFGRENPNRTFRYALTQLRVQAGRCELLNDGDGFLHVTNRVQKLTVELELWDARGNHTSGRREMVR